MSAELSIGGGGTTAGFFEVQFRLVLQTSRDI